MSDTYNQNFWDADYVQPIDEEIDPLESDEAMEEYIERRRHEFYREWYKYLESACE